MDVQNSLLLPTNTFYQWATRETQAQKQKMLRLVRVLRPRVFDKDATTNSYSRKCRYAKCSNARAWRPQTNAERARAASGQWPAAIGTRAKPALHGIDRVIHAHGYWVSPALHFSLGPRRRRLTPIRCWNAEAGCLAVVRAVLPLRRRRTDSGADLDKDQRAHRAAGRQNPCVLSSTRVFQFHRDSCSFSCLPFSRRRRRFLD